MFAVNCDNPNLYYRLTIDEIVIFDEIAIYRWKERLRLLQYELIEWRSLNKSWILFLFVVENVLRFGF